MSSPGSVFRSSLFAAPLLAGLCAPASAQDHSAGVAEDTAKAIGWVLEPGTAADNVRLLEGERYRIVFHGASARGICSATVQRYRYALGEELSARSLADAGPAPLESSTVSIPHAQSGVISLHDVDLFSVGCDAVEGVLVVDPVSADPAPTVPEPAERVSPHIPYNMLEKDTPGELPRVRSA